MARVGNEKYYYEILQLFRLNQKRSAFVGSAYGTQLGIAETFILVEVDIDPTRSARQLSESLNLEKSIISRKISSLENEGFITRERSKGDARQKMIVITEKGREFLSHHDRFNSEQLAEQGARINIEELSELQLFFKQLADGADQPAASLRPGENPLLIEMRRISRAFKIFGTSLADSGYSGVEWQVLSEISLGVPPVKAVDVSKALGLAPTTVSQIVSRFQRKGFISRQSDPEDRRSYALSLSNKGDKVLGEIDEACIAVIRNSFEKASIKFLRRSIDIFARYIAAATSSGATVSLRTEILVRKLETEKDRTRARGFLVLQLVRQNRYLSIPESILSSSGSSYVAEGGDRLQGVAEFSKKGNIGRLVQFAVSAEIENSPVARGFFKAALLQFALESDCKKIALLDFDDLREWETEISGKVSKERIVLVADVERWAA